MKRFNAAVIAVLATVVLTSCAAGNMRDPLNLNTIPTMISTSPNEGTTSGPPTASTTPDGPTWEFQGHAQVGDEAGYGIEMGVFVDVDDPFLDPADEKPGETMVVLPFDAAALYINKTPARNLPLSPANDVWVYGFYSATRPICGFLKNAVTLTAPTAGSYCVLEMGNTNDEEIHQLGSLEPGKINQVSIKPAGYPRNRDRITLQRIPESIGDQIVSDLTVGPDLYAAGMTGGITIQNMMTSTPLVSIRCSITDLELFVSEPAGIACDDQ